MYIHDASLHYDALAAIHVLNNSMVASSHGIVMNDIHPFVFIKDMNYFNLFLVIRAL